MPPDLEKDPMDRTNRPYHTIEVECWVEELRKNNPNKKYCILSKPLPDAVEVDLETGKFTALEFENSHTTGYKERAYEGVSSDFDEVYIKCRRSEVRIPLTKK